ncbi:MAG: Rieske (2Fe-2S) protein [Mucilaginibacter sp.]|uniref:QcrA and Rieske domain-containing protein n=1 Tax=Mucilaginibacter sp. TaxID=1882438 RepID=UPI0031A61EDC
MISRRDFIISGCTACVLTAAGASLLTSCASPLPMIKSTAGHSGQLIVDPNSFVAGKGNLLVVRTKQLEYDILLVKDPEGYHALYLRCTHEGVGLTPVSNKIFCSAHGSAFDLKGNVIKEPALHPLKSFPVEMVSNQIIINIS